MKKLLFVVFALMAATLVIGLTVAFTRTTDIEVETEATDEGAADEGITAEA